MLRCFDTSTKLALASLLLDADAPCKRLFIDYRGLTILHKWMESLGWTEDDLKLKEALEDILRGLPISHKTMLQESKVLSTIQAWSESNGDVCEIKSEEKPDVSTAYRADGSPAQSGSPIEDSAPAFDNSTTRAESPKKEPNLQDPFCVPMDVDALPPGTDESANPDANDFIPLPSASDPLPTVPSNVISSENEPLLNQAEDISAIVSDTLRKVVNVICSQSGDGSVDELGTAEVYDDKMPVDVTPAAKPDVQPDVEDTKEKRIERVKKKAAELLEAWRSLKDVFKIPKKEMSKLRAEHEREVDRNEARFRASQAALNRRTVNGGINGDVAQQEVFKRRQDVLPPSGHFSSYRREAGGGVRSDSPPGFPPGAGMPPPPQRPRISRLDDKSGLLHQDIQPLSREHRRQLFMSKAETEEMERHRRTLLQQQHENKCYYLRLDAAITPMFQEYPEFYFEPVTNQWLPMPEPYPPVDVTWGYPKMALLPPHAFKEGDPILDPAYFYPPGVVPVSYLYEPPPHEEVAGRHQAVLAEVNPGANSEVSHYVVARDANPSEASSFQSYPLPFLNSEPTNDIPFLDQRGPDTVQPDYDAREPETILPAPSSSTSCVPSTSAAVDSYPGGAPRIVVKLPPSWRVAKDANGRPYYYNMSTGDCQWEPPVEDQNEILDTAETCNEEVADMETASLGSPDGDDDSDEEEEEEEENGNGEDTGNGEEEEKRQAEIDIISSDLSAQEKELLLARRKRSKQERRMMRKQRQERDREKRITQRKERRKRHFRHCQSGLVTEHHIPVSSCLFQLQPSALFTDVFLRIAILTVLS
jgi:histone-lysine N-methyltransferase SETD2